MDPTEATHPILIPGDAVEPSHGVWHRCVGFYRRQRAETHFISGFLAIISVGTLLLLLPMATPDDRA